MTSKGPFQPEAFCDSVILWLTQIRRYQNVFHLDTSTYSGSSKHFAVSVNSTLKQFADPASIIKTPLLT